VKHYKMDGEKYLSIRGALRSLGGVHVKWHPESKRCGVSGDILKAANDAFKSGDITTNQLETIYNVFAPENIVY